jgi:hypothetical protein
MSSKIFQSLLTRLNNVFEKSPQSLVAFQIKPPAQAKLVIQDRLLTVTAVNNSSPLFSISFDDTYDSAKAITIRTLYDALSDSKIITVQNLNVAMSGLGITSLVEGEYDIYSNQFNDVSAYTSVLWSILRPLAYLLEQAKDDVSKAIQQLGFVTAEGDFLDYWGSIFNISRYPGEPDYEYSTRLLWETVRPRLNNKAIENIVRFGVGYETKVVDLSPRMLLSDGYTNPTHIDPTKFDQDPLQVSDSTLHNTSVGSADDSARYSLGTPYTLGAFGIFVDVPISSPYYQYTTSQISDIVERHRAAGTTPYYVVTQVANEVLALINSVLIKLEQSITQEIPEDRAMFFGHDDFTFYSDHWSSSNVSKMPWYQNNLDIPSVSDNTILATSQVTVPPPLSTVVNSYLLNAALADGFGGSFNANLVRADGAGTSDQYAGLIHNTIQFPTGDPKVIYTYSPVLLNYKRYSDEPLTPRVVEGFGDDVMTVTTSGISGTIAAWQGTGAKANVAGSDDVTITTPLRIVGPTSISGLKFDAIALLQQNTHERAVVTRNLEIPNFGQGWQTGYPLSRVFLVPYQDTCGNRYYEEISWPVNLPPPAIALQIANPTATISATSVQVASGGSATVSWQVTNSSAADLTVQLLNVDGTNSTFTDTPVTFAGNQTYNNILKTGTYAIVATGNNGQTASASITITVVAVPLVASAPLILATAFPDKVTLCDAKSSVITYSVDFNSKQTENRTLAWPAQADSFDLSPTPSDPAGTIIINSRVPTVSRISDGLVIRGGWIGFNSGIATFTPLDTNQVAGQSLLYNYDVNYGGSTLAFNGTSISLPNMGEVYQISQQATVDLPGPKQVINSGSLVFQTSYTVNYPIKASNYAATSTVSIPVYVSSIQKGSGNLAITNVSPSSLVEAIGNTMNETVPITLTGTGFSSNMQVFLLKSLPRANDNLNSYQYVEAHISSLDWSNGTLTFIAPRFEMGSYPIILNQLDCLGNVIATDATKTLVYNESTFRHPPFISDINPKTVCVSGGFTSAKVTLMGYNFRSGAQVYMLVGATQHSVATTFVNDTSLVISMDVSTTGSYNLLVVNTDTSSGATNNQPLKVMPSTTMPVIDQYGYNPPPGPGGCTTYGGQFVFYWSCSNASYVNFTSSDPKVQAQFNSPDINGWPAVGSITTKVFSRGTTITLAARNECGNQATQLLTISNPSCDTVTGISISPNPIVLSKRQPITPSTLAHHRLFTAVGVYTETAVDVTADAAHSYQLAGDDNSTAGAINSGYSVQNGNVVVNNPIATLSGKVLMPVRNGMLNLQAFWNGFITESPVYVQLPVPVTLTATPGKIQFTNINETQQLAVTVTYSDGSNKTVTSTCSYFDYDPTVISVSPVGLITTKANGTTNIRVSFVDNSVDPTVYVYANVAVGPIDTCIAFSRLWTEPAYALATAPVTNVRWVVSGPNSATYNIASDSQGSCVLDYVGKSAGTDTIQAFLDEFGVSSNQAAVAWTALNNIIGHTPVTAQFFFSDGSGVFNTAAGTIPAFTQTLSSLIYNISGPVYGMPRFLDGDRTRPMFAVMLDSNAASQGVQSITGNGYSAGVSPLKHFNAVFTGSFIVKQACTIDFGVWGDDGYVFGIGGGATRISGNYTNAPVQMPFTGVPVMGARNIDGQAGFDDIIVSFPAAGLYPFEINYSEGGGDHYVFICVACQYGVGTPQPIPVVSVSAPAALPQSSLTTPVGIRISPIVAGPNFVGSDQQLSAKVIGLTRSPVVLHVNATNVRAASVNGVAVLNQNLLSDWNYDSAEVVTATKQYRVNISNIGSGITATTVANVMSFPLVTQASIVNFGIYSPVTNVGTSSAITVKFGEPIGLVWNVKDAKLVQVLDIVQNVTYNLSAAGTMYLVPKQSGSYTLTAIGVDGSTATKTVSVVLSAQYSSQILNSAPWVQIGQSSTLTPPTGIASATLTQRADNAISLDGSRPTPGIDISIPVYASSFVGTVQPTTNSFYHYQLTTTLLDCSTPEFDVIPDPVDSEFLYRSGARAIRTSQAVTTCTPITTVTDLYAAVNADSGPQFLSAIISPGSIAVGQAVTISYNAVGACNVVGDFVGSKNLPIGSATFIVYPDRNTNYTLTATSTTGLTTSVTLHVDVAPQQLSAICSSLPFPVLNSIALDGIAALNGAVPQATEDEEIRILEIFGDHILGDRTATPDVIDNVQVLIMPNNQNTTITGIEVVEISSVSNTYVRAKVRTHAYTKADRYVVALANDVGVTTNRSTKVIFAISPRVPDFIMNNPVTGAQGGLYDFYLDSVDPVRDQGLALVVNGAAVKPLYVGSNMDDATFVDGLYSQVLDRTPSAAEQAGWLNSLATGMTRRVAMESFLTSDEYRKRGIAADLALGTKVTVKVPAAVSSAIGIQTNNGYGNTQVQFLIAPVPPAIPAIVNSNPQITGVYPMQGKSGDTITVVGSNFVNGCTVYLGTTSCSTVFVNSNTLQMTIPGSFTQSSQVALSVLGVSASTTTQYFYVIVDATPVITSVTPNVAATGTLITVAGANFTGSSIILVGGRPQTTTFVSSTKITFVAPSQIGAISPDVEDLYVSNLGLTSAVVSFTIQSSAASGANPSVKTSTASLSAQPVAGTVNTVSAGTISSVPKTDVSVTLVGNSAVAGSSVMQPSAVISTTGGLSTTAPSTTLPVSGAYQPQQIASSTSATGTPTTIATVPVVTTQINNSVIANPTTLNIAIIDHSDPSTNRLQS